MLHARSTRPWMLATLLVAEAFAATSALAIPIDGGVEGPTPDVFYNFYVPPVAAAAHAALLGGELQHAEALPTQIFGGSTFTIRRDF